MPLSTFAGGALVGTRYRLPAPDASDAGDHAPPKPWVLALHGWRRDHHDFDAVLAGLDAIALDLPGFGAAAAPPSGWDTTAYAAWIAPVLGEMADGPVVLGHSFGGRVAIRLAETHPDKVGALVLTGVPLQRPAGGRRRVAPSVRLARALRRVGVVSDARMETLRHRHGSADYRAATGTMREVLVKSIAEDGQYDAALAGFDGPVELVWGVDDTAATVAGARATLESCAAGNLIELAGVDHFTPQKAPDELRAAVLRHAPAT
jgi:pimeloyl-ACP methyl ester carboxylesterase